MIEIRPITPEDAAAVGRLLQQLGYAVEPLQVSARIGQLVEVLKLTTLRGCFCALRIGERHRLGFRGFAISRLAGFREIPRSRIILRHLREPCHLGHSVGPISAALDKPQKTDGT